MCSDICCYIYLFVFVLNMVVGGRCGGEVINGKGPLPEELTGL